MVGSITVTMPPGRALRTGERDLLTDFASQAGLAFRNAMLQAELAARVWELVQSSAGWPIHGADCSSSRTRSEPNWRRPSKPGSCRT